MIIESKKKLYYHDCKDMGCRVIKDDKKDPCRFCGRKKWKTLLVTVETNVIERE